MGKSPRMHRGSCFDDSVVHDRALSCPNAKRLSKAQSMRSLVATTQTSPHKRSIVVANSCISPMRAICATINETCSSDSIATPTTFSASTIPESTTTPEISFNEHAHARRSPHRLNHDSCFDDNDIRDRVLSRSNTKRLGKVQSMRNLVSHQTSPHKKSIVMTTSCKSPMKFRDMAAKGTCSSDSTATPTTFTSSAIPESTMTDTPGTTSSSSPRRRQSAKHQHHHLKQNIGRQEDDDDSFRPTHDFDGFDFDSPSCWEPEDIFFISKPSRVPQFYLSRIPEVKEDVSSKKSTKLIEMEQLELAVKRGCELASKGYKSATAAACAFDQNNPDATSKQSATRSIVHARPQDRHDKRNHAASQVEKNNYNKPDLRVALRRSTSMRSCRTLGGLAKPNVRHPHVSPKKRTTTTAPVKSATCLGGDALVKSKSETFTETGLDSFSDLNTWGNSDRITHDDW